MPMVRDALEKNNAGRQVGRVPSLVGAPLAQWALNERGPTTFRSLATRIYSVTLCLGGIIVMMMMALLARQHARGFLYLIFNHYNNLAGQLTSLFGR